MAGRETGEKGGRWKILLAQIYKILNDFTTMMMIEDSRREAVDVVWVVFSIFAQLI